MTAPTVRAARPADDARVDELRRRAADEAAGRRGGPELLATTGPAPADTTSVLVAEVDGVVLAYASLERRGDRLVLSELFTEPRAREVGLGHALVEAAVDAARRLGCTAIESVALPGDRDTKNFFESHGMRARLLVVARDLDPA